MDKYEQANQDLGFMVMYAANKLAPIIGVQVSKKFPSVHLSHQNYYSSSRGILGIEPKNVLTPDKKILGHEVTHWLHDLVNPGVNSIYGSDDEASNLCELVAFYGGNIFASIQHDELKEPTQRLKKITDEFTEEDWSILSFDPGADWMEDYYHSHEGGERAADFLFRRYGDSHFKNFALAGVEAAKIKLNELGYHGELFVQYKDADQYITIEKENGEDIQVINVVINDF